MVYRREFDPASSDSLAKLARWIRPGSTVLELGAAAGYFTEHLRSLGCVVDIVEIDPEAAKEAQSYARRTIVGDLDGDEWMAAVGEARYDAIVCADVLEHLRDGGRLLARLAPFLRDGGELLLSVPNIAHSAIIASLVDERFDYGEEGLLDTTHTHFYTWRSLGKLLNEAGFAVRAWDATTLDLFDTEFRVRSESLTPTLRETLARRPNARVYQWLVRATPGEDDILLEPASSASSADRVPVRLLCGSDAKSLSLEQAIVNELPIGAGMIELDWKVPAPAAVHRLMLADRIGIVRMSSWRLFAGAEPIWSSEGLPAGAPCSDSAIRIDDETMALIAPDAWIESGAAPDIAARADRVTATLEWPAGVGQAGEYHAFDALASMLYARRDVASRLKVDLDTIRPEAARLADALVRAQGELEHARDELARRAAHINRLDEEIAGYRAENARLDAAVSAQERIIAYRQSARWWIKLPLVRARLWWHRLTRA